MYITIKHIIDTKIGRFLSLGPPLQFHSVGTVTPPFDYDNMCVISSADTVRQQSTGGLQGEWYRCCFTVSPHGTSIRIILMKMYISGVEQKGRIVRPRMPGIERPATH